MEKHIKSFYEFDESQSTKILSDYLLCLSFTNEYVKTKYLSFDYVLEQICRIENIPFNPEHRISHNAMICDHDELWKKICDANNWIFYSMLYTCNDSEISKEQNELYEKFRISVKTIVDLDCTLEFDYNAKNKIINSISSLTAEYQKKISELQKQRWANEMWSKVCEKNGWKDESPAIKKLRIQ